MTTIKFYGERLTEAQFDRLVMRVVRRVAGKDDSASAGEVARDLYARPNGRAAANVRESLRRLARRGDLRTEASSRFGTSYYRLSAAYQRGAR